jgi:hypothetical protein
MNYKIAEAKARFMSNMGFRIKLWQDGELWRWQWNTGTTGSTNANSKAVALVFALETP